MFGLGFTEILLILVVVILLFGAKRLPELGAGLGEGIKNFKKGYRESKSIDITPPESATPPPSNDSSKGK